MKIAPILKWTTVGMLTSTVLFFFLPYLPYGALNYNGLQIIKTLFSAGGDWGVEGILRFAVPVFFCFVAGLLTLKNNIPTAIISTVLCLISAAMYSSYMGKYIENDQKILFGLWINCIISFIGVILPITTIVFKKLDK